MAQREVLDFLKSKPNQKFSTKMLSERLELDKRIITKDVKMLNKFNLIDLEVNKKHQNSFTFGFFTKK